MLLVVNTMNKKKKKRALSVIIFFSDLFIHTAHTPHPNSTLAPLKHSLWLMPSPKWALISLARHKASLLPTIGQIGSPRNAERGRVGYCTPTTSAQTTVLPQGEASIRPTERTKHTKKERIGGDEAEGKGGKRREENKTTQLGKRNGYSTDLSDGRRAEKWRHYQRWQWGR